jgi:ATP phosphoribosyltransferase regulatory subunit
MRPRKAATSATRKVGALSARDGGGLGAHAPRALRAPWARLPLGLRDYLPEAARARRQVAEACLLAFERWGYRRVITPLYEYADVLARGSSAAALRFVEPQSGEVVALCPDITPQIARLVATRFGALPGPLRLCYEGSVLRSSGPRGPRELIQAGVELVSSPRARKAQNEDDPAQDDAEVIGLAACALSEAGCEELTIDIGHMGFLRGALAGTDAALHEALAKKDAARVARLCASISDPQRRKLVAALPRLAGEPKEVLREARTLCRGPLAAHLDELGLLLARLRELLVPARIVLDLGETQGMGYYTGVRFAGFASGAGEALFLGGRYDELCGRYGRDMRATGFAVDVEALAATLEARGQSVSKSGPEGVLVCGGPRAFGVAQAIRRKGVRACVLGENDASAAKLWGYAERWGFARVLCLRPRGAAYVDRDGNQHKLSQAELKELRTHG